MQIQNALLNTKNYFYKMHGAGNDFIIINGTDQDSYSQPKASSIAQSLCHRKFGIGADGLLVVRKVGDIFKMQVINSDGSLPNMCGNGLRCFVTLLYHLKFIPSVYTVLTDDGQKSVEIYELPENTPLANKKYTVMLKIGKGGQITSFPDQKYSEIYLTTIGVPHLVIFLSHQQFQTVDFQLEGKHFQKKFDANINFCRIQEANFMSVKTYERGAGLTYACGTGVSSSVYVAVVKSKIHNQPIKVKTDGGEIMIEVTELLDVIMKGPAEIICEGTFKL